MALSFAGIGQKVGLQLLLAPQQSEVLLRGACAYVGGLYPAYATYKLLESKPQLDEAENKRWLTYWMVYGGLTLVEGGTAKHLSWFPYYYHAKLGLLLWLQLHNTQGAVFLYNKYVQPTLKKYQKKIDVCLDTAYTLLAATYAAHRVPIETAIVMLTAAASQARTFAAWFIAKDDTDVAPTANQ